MSDRIEPPFKSPRPTAEETVQFVFNACRFFGATLATSHHVAALVAEECERIEASRVG